MRRFALCAKPPESARRRSASCFENEKNGAITSRSAKAAPVAFDHDRPTTMTARATCRRRNYMSVCGAPLAIQNAMRTEKIHPKFLSVRGISSNFAAAKPPRHAIDATRDRHITKTKQV